MSDRWVNVRGRWVLVPGGGRSSRWDRQRSWYVPRSEVVVVRAAEVPLVTDPNASVNWPQLTAGVIIGVLALAIVGRLT